MCLEGIGHKKSIGLRGQYFYMQEISCSYYFLDPGASAETVASLSNTCTDSFRI